MTILTLVAALARNHVIGIQNRLPWHLPEDLRHFKALTWGKPVVMGRKTFDSIQRPLPGRRNIVVTRQAHWCHPGVEVAASFEAALSLVKEADEACVIGGADLYGQAMGYASRLCLTEIEAEFEGDAFFPPIDRTQWDVVTREVQCSPSGMVFAFVEYGRRR